MHFAENGTTPAGSLVVALISPPNEWCRRYRRDGGSGHSGDRATGQTADRFPTHSQLLRAGAQWQSRSRAGQDAESRLREDYQRVSCSSGSEYNLIPKSVLETTVEEREREFDRIWYEGGFAFWLANYQDMFFSHEANDICADYIKRKIQKM